MTTLRRGSMPAVLRGMGLIARGRAEGLNCFGDSPKALLASLVPGFGFMMGAAIDGLANGQGASALGDMLGPLCALLAPPVLSYELARYWGRDAFWGRYIVAFNWCQWLLPLIGLLFVACLTAANLAGVAGQGGIEILVFGLACYALWMNWFIARHGLALSGGRAALFVGAVNLGTMVLAFGPVLLVASLA
jgi:hypothetical protein